MNRVRPNASAGPTFPKLILPKVAGDDLAGLDLETSPQAPPTFSAAAIFHRLAIRTNKTRPDPFCSPPAGDLVFSTTLAGTVPGTKNLSIVATAAGTTTTRNFQVGIGNAGTRNFSYDLNGNLTSDGVRTYVWDAADRLVQITQGGNVTEFAYDGLGRRMREKLGGVVIKQWVWAGDEIAEERDGGNVTTKRFYPQGEQQGGVNLYYTRDHLGSVREMTDSAGNVRARYAYDPYGQTTKVSGDLEASFGFTGHYRHQSSGLYLARYRAYDPYTARWLSRDPLEEEGGINLYGYCYNDPVNMIDSDGRLPMLVSGLLGGAVSFGMQMAMNGGRLECVDWADVGISAVASASGAGLVSVLGKASKLGRASRVLAKAEAKKGPLTNYMKGQVASANAARASAAGAAGGFAGAQAAKGLVDGKSSKCEEEEPCK